MASYSLQPNPITCNNLANTSGSAATLSLNSAYVHLTSGAAVAIRVNAKSTDTITEVFVYINSFTGTKSAVGLRARIYAENPGNANRPSNTLLAQTDIAGYTLPAGTSGWCRIFNFDTPYAPANIGEVFWIVIFNTSSNPTVDFPVLKSTGAAVAFRDQNFFYPYSTTNGWTTDGTVQARLPCYIIQGGEANGLPYSNATTPVATNTRARGFVFTPPVDCILRGMWWQTAPGNTMNQIRIWESTQVPSDTPVYQFNTGQTGRASSELGSNVSFEPFFEAKKGKTYYITWSFTANSTHPPCLSVEDYAAYSSNIDQMIDNFTTLPLVRDNGSNAFVIERQFTPRMALFLSELKNPTVTSSS